MKSRIDRKTDRQNAQARPHPCDTGSRTAASTASVGKSSPEELSPGTHQVLVNWRANGREIHGQEIRKSSGLLEQTT